MHDMHCAVLPWTCCRGFLHTRTPDCAAVGPQALKHQEWTAALQVEHGKLAAKQRAELQAAAEDLEAK
jgi:hypothetical protein